MNLPKALGVVSKSRPRKEKYPSVENCCDKLEVSRLGLYVGVGLKDK